MGDNLKELLKKMGKAKHSLWTNRNSRDYFKSQMPLIGHITATEVKYMTTMAFTLIIMFFNFDKQYQAEDLEIIESDLYEFWAEKCVKQGLGKPSRTWH